jgi:chromate transporter
MVWAISVAYVRFGGLPWMEALFYGIGAAVIGIIVRSAQKLATPTLGTSLLLWVIAIVMALATAWTEREIVWLFLLAGALAPADARQHLLDVRQGGRLRLRQRAGDRSLPLRRARADARLAERPPVSRRGGGGDDHAGTSRHHLAFIGYVVAGEWGMTIAAVGVFLPVYLFVVLPAPYFRRHRSQPIVKGFVEGVSAAATGAIGGAAFVLATRAVVDGWTAAIALATFGVLFHVRVSELWLIARAAILGLVLGGAA